MEALRGKTVVIVNPAADAAARQNAVLGCLPAGSGCDFARHLGIPLDFQDAALRLESDTVRRLDVVRAEISFGQSDSKTVYLTNMAAFDSGARSRRWSSKTARLPEACCPI